LPDFPYKYAEFRHLQDVVEAPFGAPQSVWLSAHFSPDPGLWRRLFSPFYNGRDLFKAVSETFSVKHGFNENAFDIELFTQKTFL
jgi:hypothetical protein